MVCRPRTAAPEVDACPDDLVARDAEIVQLEIGARDVWLLGRHDAGPPARGGRRCRVGHDVDQMWTRDSESAAGFKTATL